MNRDAYVPRRVAAAAVGVTTTTFNHWQERGWVTPDGQRRTLTTRPNKRRRGHLEYLLGDVLDAARDTKLNPRNPGRQTRILITV
ncbi:hypothetical protein GCM10011608_09770 [Micromonospora sonchi]|uniref:Uncharacterized protein n=1 Tax=Micromonospora sonchi TaxID=1763543 RepID=A0A917TM05_9ACTN|nr:hypothetical protein [Micromonospora sonchi]GGM27006.1 hypothetical protein GCM10011608_09770 [Micromonospora sonchi]